MKYKEVSGGVCAPLGFTASGIHCGLRKSSNNPDLALIFAEKPCVSTAVYTQNKVKGAPILVTQKHLQDFTAQAVIVNSGNANTCNLDGEEKAIAMCKLAGEALNIPPNNVIVASTGIIGQVLPLEPIQNQMIPLKNGLSRNGNSQASQAIMTTDLVEKVFAISFELGGKPCTIGGIAKGSGMIHPNMATMLCFLTSDVAIDGKILDTAVKSVVDDTFNMISVDGDTSTNDMVSVMCSGLAGNPEISDVNSSDYSQFHQALTLVMEVLCKKIAQDGEGATKLLECQVTGMRHKNQARTVAKSVITSSLFKSAMFGKDPNWGRILCAIGYAEGEFSVEQVKVTLKSALGEVIVCENGRGVDFQAEKASHLLSATEIFILVDMNQGDQSATAWGCDLTYDYVKINADYHT